MAKDSGSFEQSLRKIHYGGWASEDYGRLVEAAYREQAARLMQRMVRSWLGKKHQNELVLAPDQRRALTKDIGAVSLIQEPLDDKYKEHVNKISEEAYLELDYQDPQFVRNLFKALRLNKITQNQLLMADSIYRAKEWLKDYDYPGVQLRTFDFSEHNSPYKINRISYLNLAKVGIFYDSLHKENKKYMTLNFPRHAETLFFLHGLECLKLHPFFRAFLTHYLLHAAINEQERKDFADKIALFKVFPANVLADIKEILVKIYERNSGVAAKLTEIRLLESIDFLANILVLQEENPALVLSPDYKKDDVNTPTLALVLMTLEAETQLQLLLHGEEATLPVPTAGAVSTRMIRAADERPEPFKIQKNSRQKGKLTDQEIAAMRGASAAEILGAVFGTQYTSFAQPVRPVEILHPDLPRTDKPHGYDVYPFLLTWHDRFHCWRAGANFKTLLRHEIKLFTNKGVCQTQAFVMSKAIWWLLDRDISLGHAIRQRNSRNENSEELIAGYLLHVMNQLGVAEHDDLLLLQFIDFIKNAKKWLQFIQEMSAVIVFSSLKAFVARNAGRDYSVYGCSSLVTKLVGLMKDESITDIIRTYVDKKPSESIILRCKLKAMTKAACLCDEIDNAGISQFFYWGKNSGLYFQAKFHAQLKKVLGLNTFALDDLTQECLFLAVLICIKELVSAESFQSLIAQLPVNAVIAGLPEKEVCLAYFSVRCEREGRGMYEVGLFGDNKRLRGGPSLTILAQHESPR